MRQPPPPGGVPGQAAIWWVFMVSYLVWRTSGGIVAAVKPGPRHGGMPAAALW